MAEARAVRTAVSFDDDSIQYEQRQGGEMNRFRLESGQVARIALFKPNVDMVLAHYIKGRYMCCRADKPDGCPGCEHKGEPKRRYGLNVIWYVTDKQGNVPKNKPLEIKVGMWGFGDDKFVMLRGIKQEFGDLTKMDLKIHCSDGQFQKYQILPCKDLLWRMDPERARNEFVPLIKRDSYNILQIIGKEWTREDMMRELREEDPNIVDKGSPVTYEDGEPAPSLVEDGEPVDYSELLDDI